LTGDCPLVDPALVDRHIDRFIAGQPATEYVTNAMVRTYPDGLDVEVMSRRSLVEADRAASDAFDREHVTPWIQRHVRVVAVTQPVDLSALRWVLDTPADYEAIAAIYAELLPVDSAFDSRAVYRLLTRRPDLIRVAGDLPVDDMVTRIRALLAAEPAG
jgi:spore coat polysaccharide biosynthesis protein SpsF